MGKVLLWWAMACGFAALIAGGMALAAGGLSTRNLVESLAALTTPLILVSVTGLAIAILRNGSPSK